MPRAVYKISEDPVGRPLICNDCWVNTTTRTAVGRGFDTYGFGQLGISNTNNVQRSFLRFNLASPVEGVSPPKDAIIVSARLRWRASHSIEHIFNTGVKSINPLLKDVSTGMLVPSPYPSCPSLLNPMSTNVLYPRWLWDWGDNIAEIFAQIMAPVGPTVSYTWYESDITPLLTDFILRNAYDPANLSADPETGDYLYNNFCLRLDEGNAGSPEAPLNVEGNCYQRLNVCNPIPEHGAELIIEWTIGVEVTFDSEPFGRSDVYLSPVPGTTPFTQTFNAGDVLHIELSKQLMDGGAVRIIRPPIRFLDPVTGAPVSVYVQQEGMAVTETNYNPFDMTLGVDSVRVYGTYQLIETAFIEGAITGDYAGPLTIVASDGVTDYLAAITAPGLFSIEVPIRSTYTVRVAIVPANYTCSPPSYTVTPTTAGQRITGVNFALSAIAPIYTLHLTGPQSGTVGDILNYTVTLTQNGAPVQGARVALVVDESLREVYRTTDINGNATIPWDTSTYGEGPHTVRAYAFSPYDVESQETIQVTLSIMPPVYTLTIATSDIARGTTYPVPGEYTLDAGTSLWVEAIPRAGFVFNYWQLDTMLRTDNPTKVDIVTNYVLTAFFTEIAYGDLTIEVRGIKPEVTATVKVNTYTQERVGPGTVTFMGIYAKSYACSVSAPGYTTKSIPVTVIADQMVQYIVNLAPCFIATAAYGTPLAPELNVLRKFRDKCLPNLIVAFYYKTSPPMAEYIRRHMNVRRIVREVLSAVVNILRRS